MKKFSFIVLGAIVLSLPSCDTGKSFRIEGTVASAEGDTMYLEHRGLAGVTQLDSIVLKGNGSFKFKQPAPDNPEFYQLRIEDRLAVFAVDSIETLHVQGDATDFYNTFTVKDSPTNDQMKRVDILTRGTALKISELEKRHEGKSIDDVEFMTQLDSVLNDYKQQITGLILGNPSGAAAYYAVFQKINDYLIFDPYNKQDYAMFGAVATSWNRYYPGTSRTKHLYDFTMNALKVRRQQEQQMKLLENVEVVTESSLPDIILSDMKGQKMALSSLKGKVVLLDFTVYNSDFSPKHNMDLNALYNRYKSRGLEIYQISVDSDDHFWKNAADNVPWITVRDPRSVYSPLLSTYNVRELPTAFILDREGDVVAKVEDYSLLGNELDKML